MVSGHAGSSSTANASGLDRDSFGRARIRLFTTVLGHRLESPSTDRLIAIHWYAVRRLARVGNAIKAVLPAGLLGLHVGPCR